MTDLAQAQQLLAKVIPWSESGDSFCGIHWTWMPKDLEPGRKLPWTGRACRNLEEAVRAVEFAMKNPNTRDIFFAAGTQRTAQERTSQSGLRWYNPIRNAGNVTALKALYLDIDVGKEDGYKDLTEAIEGLAAFIKKVGLPRPSMCVASGGGLHAYYVLAKALTPDEWRPLSFALANAAKTEGLRCDYAVTTDCARVLRVPCTQNWKTSPPRPVQLAGTIADFDYALERIAKPLAAYKVAVPAPAAPLFEVPGIAPRPPLKGENELSAGIETAMPQAELRACLDAIPNTKVDWNRWNTIGMRAYAACDGADYGLAEWERWSAPQTPADAKDSCKERWATFHHSPPTRTGAGALINEVRATTNDSTWSPRVTSRVTPTAAPTDSPSFADPYADFVGPSFPTFVLPPVLADFVEAQHRAMGADPSALAMAALTAAAGAVNSESKIKMGEGWFEPPVIWTALIGPPSSMKSPIIDKTVKPLRRADADRDASWRAARAQWQQANAAGTKPGPCPPRPARCIVQDATAEKIAEILSRDPAGSLMVQDELAGWLGSFERYSSGPSSRAFFLTSWNGGLFLKDRVGQGARDDHAEIRVDNLALGILGGIQPDRLAALRDLTSDGLLQRFLPVLMRPAERGNERHPVSAAEAEYAKLMRSLLAATPCTYSFAPDAEKVVKRILDRLFELEQLDGFSGVVIGALGKMKGYSGRLALTLHLAGEHSRLVRSQTTIVGQIISRQTAEDVERLIFDFLLPHIFAMYDVVSDGGQNRDALRSVADFILSTDKDRLRPSDFGAGVRKLRGEPTNKIAEWASRFCAMGWIRPEDDAVKTPKAWLVERGLRDYFGARRLMAKDARAAAHAILKAGGTRR